MVIGAEAVAAALSTYGAVKPGHGSGEEYVLLVDLLTDLKHWAAGGRGGFEDVGCMELSQERKEVRL